MLACILLTFDPQPLPAGADSGGGGGGGVHVKCSKVAFSRKYSAITRVRKLATMLSSLWEMINPCSDSQPRPPALYRLYNR